MPARDGYLLASDDALIAQSEVDRYRASGPGGQHRNKTESAVRLRHKLTGVSAIGEDSRSQSENKLHAVRRLRSAIALEVREPVPLEEFAAEPRKGVRWLAALEGSVPPAAVGAEPVTIAIGPEGGFTPEERWALEAAGFAPVRFGDHILRFETAALAGAVYTSIARKRGLDG